MLHDLSSEKQRTGYIDAKIAQLLLTNAVFASFMKAYQEQLDNLSSIIKSLSSTSLQTQPNFTAPKISIQGAMDLLSKVTSRKKDTTQTQKQAPNTDLTSLETSSRAKLQIMNNFAPSGVMHEQYAENLSAKLDELSGRPSTSYKLIFGISAMVLSPFVARTFGLKIGAVCFLVGTALACAPMARLVSYWYKRYGLDSEAKEQETPTSTAIRSTLDKITNPAGDKNICIENIKMCQEIYTQRYLPAIELVKDCPARWA